MLIVVAALELAKVTAPRRLQLVEGLHAVAAALSAVVVTVIVASGRIITTDGCAEPLLSTTRSRSPLTFRGMGSTATGSLGVSSEVDNWLSGVCDCALLALCI